MNAALEIESRRAPALAALRARIQQPSVTETVVPCLSPFAPGSVTGTKAQGRAYEKKVGKFLRRACDEAGWRLWDHQWFEYKGKEVKYFQPDFVIEREGQEGILIEVKLTYVDTSKQLNKYLEYLRLFGLNCFPITIVRNLVPVMPEYMNDFSKVTANSVLHLWI